MNRQVLIDQYDRYYRENPTKWINTKRNAFAFAALCNYFEGNLPRHHTEREGHAPYEVIDVGCGNGHTLEYFERRWPEAHYYGIDLSPEACRLAANRVRANTTIQQAFLEDDLVFVGDCILMLGVLEHIEDTAQAMTQLSGWLADGGIVYIEVPNCIGYAYSEKVEGFRELNGGSRQTEWHLFRDTWEQRFRDAGFEIAVSLVGPSITSEFVWILKKAR